MSKKQKIKKHSQQKKVRQISEKAVAKLTGSTDEEHPSFRFTYADKNPLLLSYWKSSEIDDLIAGLQKIEKYTWAQIKGHGSKNCGESVGTGYKLINSHPSLPDNIR